MSKKFKIIIKGTLFSFLFLATFYYSDKALADNQEPILIQIYDTDIGTEAFEQLVSHGNGGHAALGAILGNAQNMQKNPGIGLGIGSGGLGYRPSVTIAVWTDQPFSVSSGLDAIKAHFNVPSSPVTTNGDCVIACDGTVQEPEPVQQIVQTVVQQPEPVKQIVKTIVQQPELAQQITETVVQQPVLTQQPEPQQETQQPVLAPNNTPQYIEPIVSLEPFSSYTAPAVLTLQSSISNKVVSDKKVINKKKITTKKVARHATSKAAKRHP
jgi:hypothetical protein